MLRDNYENALSSGTIFLVDYKFADGDNTNGIQLIEELHLEDRAILVTNWFDDPTVVSAVQRLGISLVPKKYRFNIKFLIDIGAQE